MNGLKPINIGLWLIIIAAVIVELLFFESRQDPSLRIAALTIVGTLVTGILAIASTLMIGKDITQHPPQDVPPNSTGTLSTTTTVAQTIQTPAQTSPVPPLDPTALAPVKPTEPTKPV